MLEDVFQKIILNYPKLNSKQIRSEIGYALNSRNERLSKKNFEKQQKKMKKVIFFI